MLIFFNYIGILIEISWKDLILKSVKNVYIMNDNGNYFKIIVSIVLQNVLEEHMIIVDYVVYRICTSKS